MFDLLKTIGQSVLISAGLLVAANTYLFLLSQGNLGSIRLVAQIRKFANRAPSGTVFKYHDYTLAARVYDPGTDREKDINIALLGPALLTSLRWSGKSLSPKGLRKRATLDLIFRVAIIVLFWIPTVVLGPWLIFTQSWLWTYVVVIILLHQLALWHGKVHIFFKWLPFSCITATFIVHRVTWISWPLPVAATIGTVGWSGFIIVSWWAHYEQAKEAKAALGVQPA
jgi:hypothetical protein